MQKHIVYNSHNPIYLFVLFISLFSFITVKAQSIDSLIIQCEKNMLITDYETAKHNALLLSEISETYSNKRGQAYSNAYLGALNVLDGNLEKAKDQLENARNYATDSGNDTILGLAFNGLGIYYIIAENNRFLGQRYFYRGLQHADKAGDRLLKYRIKNNIVQAVVLHRDTSMLEYTIDCYNEGKTLSPRPNLSITARHIARLLILKNNLDLALKYLDEADSIQIPTDKDHLTGLMLRAEIELHKSNFKDAENYYHKALSLATNDLSNLEILIGLSKVKLGAKMFRDAIFYAEKVLSQQAKNGVDYYRGDCYEILEQAWKGLGNIDKAYEYSELSRILIEEESKIDQQSMQQEMISAFEIEKKEKEAEIQRKEIAETRQRNIILIVFIVFLSVLLVALIYMVNKKNNLYKKIVAQFRSSVKNEDKLKQQIKELISNSYADTDNTNDKMQTSNEPVLGGESEELWEKLIFEMTENKIFKSPGLTREILAKQLGTNRTYLTNIIMKKTGLNYTQFLNSYRITEAIKILSDKNNDNIPLKALSIELGFNSMTSFYNLFKNHTGMTPATFRKNA